MAKSKLNKCQVGDRVEWEHSPIESGGANDGKTFRGKIRALKSEEGYRYAVVATEPYGHILMPSLAVLSLCSGCGLRADSCGPEGDSLSGQQPAARGSQPERSVAK